MGWTHMPDNQ